MPLSVRFPRKRLTSRIYLLMHLRVQTGQLPADLRAKRSNDLEEIASCELQNRVLSVEENGHAAVDGAVAQDAEERDIKKPVLALWPTLTRRRELEEAL